MKSLLHSDFCGAGGKMIIPILGSKSVSLPPFGNFMFRFLFCIQAVMFYPNSTKRKRENKITISIWFALA